MTPDERAKSDAFWQPLIRTDGVLDETKILNELSDYSFLLENVPQVYMEISNGKLSKPNYPASVMIGEFEQTVIDAVAEETADLEKGHAAAIAELEARLAMAVEALKASDRRIWEHHEVGHIERAAHCAPGKDCEICSKESPTIFARNQAVLEATAPAIAAFLARVERRGAAKELRAFVGKLHDSASIAANPNAPPILLKVANALEARAAELERR